MCQSRVQSERIFFERMTSDHKLSSAQRGLEMKEQRDLKDWTITASSSSNSILKKTRWGGVMESGDIDVL